MTDTGFSDIKVLRRELKARNLSAAGSKSELIARLQSASSKDEDNLSDELDSDGELDDEVEKDHDLSEYHLESEGSDVHLAASQTPDVQIAPKVLAVKRKPPSLSADLDKAVEDRLLSPESPTKLTSLDNKIGIASTSVKKIVLNRSTSAVVPAVATLELANAESQTKSEDAPKRMKITVDSDSRLEMRAKRFGLPPTDDARKEARKLRFGNGTAPTSGSTTFRLPQESKEDLDKLKKRAERFGASVSKVLTDLELKDRIQKRKAKFGAVAQ